MQKQTHLVSPAWSKARLTKGVSFVLDATDDSGDNRYLSLTKHEIRETQQEPGEHASATHTDPEKESWSRVRGDRCTSDAFKVF